MGLLLHPDPQVSASAATIRQAAASTTLSGEIDTVIAATLIARFSGRSIPELWAIGGISLDDFTSSAIYQKIFGHGSQEGHRKAASRAARQRLQPLLSANCSGTVALSAPSIRLGCKAALDQLEALAFALLDFQGAEDLADWLEVLEG